MGFGVLGFWVVEHRKSYLIILESVWRKKTSNISFHKFIAISPRYYYWLYMRLILITTSLKKKEAEALLPHLLKSNFHRDCGCVTATRVILEYDDLYRYVYCTISINSL